MTDEARVADHIGLLSRLLAEQVVKAGGWPASNFFPKLQDADEREAFSLFIREPADHPREEPLHHRTRPRLTPAPAGLCREKNRDSITVKTNHFTSNFNLKGP
jgi:hypothetical protein